MDYSQHEIEWNCEKVARFWENLLAETGSVEAYFSQKVGRGVIRFIQRIVPLRGRVLDYGCGPGYLIKHILKADVTCEGADFSPAAVQKANMMFASYSRWKGARVFAGENLPWPDATFDFIISLETLEHVLPDQLTPMLSELRRILKPGGHLFLSTPNAEDLAANQIICPECGCVFHRYQHLRSFTASGLQALMEGHSFATNYCGATNFERFQPPTWPGWLNITPRHLLRWVWYWGCLVFDGLHLPGAPVGGYLIRQFGDRADNLYWIGSNRSSF